jgi:hypothetical protein
MLEMYARNRSLYFCRSLDSAMIDINLPLLNEEEHAGGRKRETVY